MIQLSFSRYWKWFYSEIQHSLQHFSAFQPKRNLKLIQLSVLHKWYLPENQLNGLLHLVRKYVQKKAEQEKNLIQSKPFQWCSKVIPQYWQLKTFNHANKETLTYFIILTGNFMNGIKKCSNKNWKNQKDQRGLAE